MSVGLERRRKIADEELGTAVGAGWNLDEEWTYESDTHGNTFGRRNAHAMRDRLLSPEDYDQTMTPRYHENLERYEALVATSPAIERKGATMPYTSVNGHMFSLLTKEGSLVLRLSPEDHSAFRKKYKTPPVVLYGAVMKEYVEVPDALLAKTASLKKFFDASFQYVRSLKPKPTKQTKKKAR